MHLLGFGEGLTVSAVADDVVAREALGLIQFGRLQHPQADINDHIRSAFDGHSDECQTVAGGNCRRWLVGVAHILRAVVADQESCDPQGTGFNFWRELQLDQRALAATAR